MPSGGYHGIMAPRGTGTSRPHYRSSLPKAPMPSGGYHRVSRLPPEGSNAPPSRRLQCLREGIIGYRASLPKAPMPSGGYHGIMAPRGTGTSRPQRLSRWTGIAPPSRRLQCLREGIIGYRSSLPKAPMPSGGYHGIMAPRGTGTSRPHRSSLPKAPMLLPPEGSNAFGRVSWPHTSQYHLALPSRRLQCLREGIMAPHIPAWRRHPLPQNARKRP